MSYRTILVHAGDDPGAQAAIRAALSLGERSGAALLGVSAIAWNAYVPDLDAGFGVTGGSVIQALRNDIDAEISAGETAFRSLCARYPHPVSWRSSLDFPARAMIELSRCADLIVAARPPKGADSRRSPFPTELVMESGLPVLVAAPGQEAVRLGAVLVAWKNTREARRALADALPLLKMADRVHVAQICEADAVGLAGPELDDVVERLARHGIRADASTSPQVGPSAADDLLDLVDRIACDLMVLGAYGHSRLREWSFGGVTRDLMESAPKNILFSR